MVSSGLIWMLTACEAWATAPAVPAMIKPAQIQQIPFDSIRRPIEFTSLDGTLLRGQWDLPPLLTFPPVVFIIHHSGAVDRESYQYLAAKLVPVGYAVFRFDKRGTGSSAGVYGCCEDDDALAAYRAAMQEVALEQRVFIIAQSIGTRILAQRWQEFAHIRQPDGVVLLSNLLADGETVAIQAPLHIIVSASETNLKAVGEEARRAHQQAYPAYTASVAVIPNSEHTLFDVSAGPIDWSDPSWPYRFHPLAWQSLHDWLERHR
jgi:alpha/beta superfamily hydrolase